MIEAAKAQGRMEGVKHLLDLVVIMVADENDRKRITEAGHSLYEIYKVEHGKFVDRFIEAARGELRRGFWKQGERA